MLGYQYAVEWVEDDGKRRGHVGCGGDRFRAQDLAESYRDAGRQAHVLRRGVIYLDWERIG